MFISSEFDIFARKPVQESVRETADVVYKPIASVDQSDLEFLIPADNETYIDPDIKLYIRGRLTKIDGTILDDKDFTSVTNNFLHSLFNQCTLSLNGTTITQATELYNYRSLLETLLTYGNDAATTHLRNGMWILDDGDLAACDPTANDSTNKGFITRWSLTKKSQEVELYGRIHTDFCNVPVYLLPGVRLQIKFTKAKTGFYLMNKDAESKSIFQFLDAQLWVKRIRPNPTIPLAHKEVLRKGGIARYNMTRVELKSFTFSSGSQSLSIDNAVLGPIPKRLLFTMVKNKDFLGSIDTNPYFFRHYDLQNFALYVNGKQIPGGGGLSLDTSHVKKSVMAYRTLFEGSGIHHSNAGLQITPDMYLNGYFMLLFDLTADRAASEGHTSYPENGNVRIELKFAKPLPDAITCLIYLEYDGTVLIDDKQLVTTDF